MKMAVLGHWSKLACGSSNVMLTRLFPTMRSMFLLQSLLPIPLKTNLAACGRIKIVKSAYVQQNADHFNAMAVRTADATLFNIFIATNVKLLWLSTDGIHQVPIERRSNQVSQPRPE